MTELQRFFERHIHLVDRCENCGMKIKDPGHKNVAHILPKEKFKNIATNDHNVLYLCCDLDRIDGNKGCHDIYDRTWKDAMSLPVWSIAVERYNKFKDQIKHRSTITLKFEE